MPYKDPAKQKAAQASHYERHKDDYHRRSREQRKRRYEKLAVIKSQPCADCGVQYSPWVMQFDHVRGAKLGTISNMVTRASWAEILEEVSKCDVVCANCHAMRTFERLGHPARYLA